MKKIDPIVIKETTYIFTVSVIFSMFMEAVFLIVKAWDYTVLLGNLLGLVAVTLNFLLMGITVQNAVTKEEKDAKSLMKLSQSGRLFMMFAFALVGYLVPVFNAIAVVVPFLFPRIAIMLRPLFKKRGDKG